MDTLQKARLLSSAGQYDSCGPKVCDVDLQHNLGGVITAKAEHTSCKMFKTLMTNACSFDCKYCVNRSGCSKQKAMYQPKEVVDLMSFLQKKHGVNGLFLSSGVAGDPDKMMERMLEAARMLRFKEKFRGYLHLKVLPGASFEMVKQAAEVADRVSINIEAPNNGVLSELSSNKDLRGDILKRQAWIKKVAPHSGQSTQLIVNDLASDVDILRMMRFEYEKMDLRRVYYSAFAPVKETPLEHKEATPAWREHRLYNVDFLLRKYKFSFAELKESMPEGMLTREDPKLVLARNNFSGRVDVNEASVEELLRVPGIGPVTAHKLQTRKVHKLSELKKLGANIHVASPFISINGDRQRFLREFS